LEISTHLNPVSRPRTRGVSFPLYM